MVGFKDFEMPSCCNSCSHWSFNRDDEPLCDLTYEYIKQFDKRQDDCPLIETYTKADMVAMLEELQSEIEEKGIDLCDNGWYLTYGDIIQHKIQTLKEQEDDKTNN